MKAEVLLARVDEILPFRSPGTPLEIHESLLRLHPARSVPIQVECALRRSHLQQVAAPRRPPKAVKGTARAALHIGQLAQRLSSARAGMARAGMARAGMAVAHATRGRR